MYDYFYIFFKTEQLILIYVSNVPPLVPSAKLSFRCHCIPASEAQQVFAVLDTHRLLTVPLYLMQNCNMAYKIL